MTQNEHARVHKLGFLGAEARRNQTHCRRGHPFTPDNLYDIGDGRRHCRICKAAWTQKYKAKKNAARRAKMRRRSRNLPGT